jgi:hypothetical protein
MWSGVESRWNPGGKRQRFGWALCKEIPHGLQMDSMSLGIVTGNPGVFLGNPHPYPWKPAPAAKGVGFYGYGCGFSQNPRVVRILYRLVIYFTNYYYLLCNYIYGVLSPALVSLIPTSLL